MHNKKVGYLFFIAGVCLYSFSDAIMKFYIPEYGVHRVVFLRTIFRLLPFVFVASCIGINPLKTNKLKTNILRGLLASAGTYSFMCAYNNATMTEVFVIGLTTGIFVIPLSVLILKEKLNLQNIISVFLGFCGICVAFRPGCGIIQFGILFAVIGAIISAFNQVIIKQLSKTENELTIIFYHHIVLICSSLICIDTGDMFSFSDGIMFLFIGGIIGSIAQYCIIHAFKLSTSSGLASAGYFMLIPNTIIDFLIYQKTPDLYIAFGLVLILLGTCHAFFIQKKL